MKNIKIYLTALLTATLISCESQLELEPKQNLDSSTALATESGVKQLLVGAYANLANGSLYGGRTQIMGDLLGASDNDKVAHINWNGTFAGFGDIYTKTIVKDNIFAEDLYRESYDVINATNIVIENSGKIKDASARKIAVAEAKFIQALVYFDLVRFFGLPYESGKTNSQLGVIIRSKAIYQYLGVDLSAERNTVEEVYALVVSHLTAAIADLPATNGEFANKYAAQALLARVYLQQQKYPEALAAANNVIANGGYSLSANLKAAYNHEVDQPEDVFAIQITKQTGDNQINNSYASTQNGGRGGDITIGPGYYSLFTDVKDQRQTFSYSNDLGDDLTLKFTDQFANVPVIRLAELLLIRAEANIRLSSVVGDTPANDINKIRNRAGAGNIATPTLANVITERKLELAFEGFWIHDAKRNKENLVGQTITYKYNDPRLVFPIPLREMNTNKKITQNPGY
jgi:starch-binding outer membrane protein, SusD/RagB family